jgi:hypothetical protein
MRDRFPHIPIGVNREALTEPLLGNSIGQSHFYEFRHSKPRQPRCLPLTFLRTLLRKSKGFKIIRSFMSLLIFAYLSYLLLAILGIIFIVFEDLIQHGMPRIGQGFTDFYLNIILDAGVLRNQRD